VDKKHRIFLRRDNGAAHIRVPTTLTSGRIGQMALQGPMRSPANAAGLRHMVDALMLDRFTPPHVLATREGEVVYYSSRTGKYLEAAPGVPSRQLVSMARKGLGLDLRTVFREAVESGRRVTRDGVAVDSDDGRVQIINLTVEPLGGQAAGDPLYLVVFADQGPVLTREEALARAQATHEGATLQLEKELRDTRERLQSMIEEYETALEELKSSNEELVSVNEELHTVNFELNGKIEALDRSNNDLKNLFESTSVATVFLDRNLVICSFTPAMDGIFHIRAGDTGRPITELASAFHLPGLKEDIAAVFASQQVHERRVGSPDGSAHYLIRLTPYRNAEQRTDGVVVAFVNITTLVSAESRQEVLIAELQHRTRNLLSVVQSIAQQTLSRGPVLETFVNRLGALGRLQGLVGKANGDVIDFKEIVRLEFDALGLSDSDRITIAGPSAPLGFRSTQTFALVLHELATNALKYGALKDEAARLDLTWKVGPTAQGADALTIRWHESGLTTVPDSSKAGFGRQLIEKALKFTLHAETELVFGADGISCHIEIPLSPVRAREEPKHER
jgi:two-component system CheB/CheR fusion protein